MKRILNKWHYIFILLFTISLIEGRYLKLIDIEKLPDDSKFLTKLNRLKQLEEYCVQPIPDQRWDLSIPKEEVQRSLRSIYATSHSFVEKDKQNGELYLYLGLIGHYAYNLEVNYYFDMAVDNYMKAAELLNKNDIRPEWFLAVLYVQAALPVQGMQLFKKITSENKITDSMFWEDYGLSSYMSQMPRNYILGLDSARAFSEYPDKYIYQAGDIRYSIIKPEPGDSISIQNTWQIIDRDSFITIINYPYCYNLSVPSSWKIYPTPCVDSLNHIKIKTGSRRGYFQDITCNLFITTKVAGDNENLCDFYKKIYPNTENFDNITLNLGLNENAYIDTSYFLYESQGGLHAIMIAFERCDPSNNSIYLEEPVEFPRLNRLQTYRWTGDTIYNRYKGRIFYCILFDCCKSIYDQFEEDLHKILKSLVFR